MLDLNITKSANKGLSEKLPMGRAGHIITFPSCSLMVS